MDKAQLWARCRAGDADSRCALIEGYAPLAARVARGMNLPIGALVGRDDLESAALVGLIDAVDRFQPERGVPFEAYAVLRIRGAILDELRRTDDRGRAQRRRDRELDTPVPGMKVSLDLLLEQGEHAALGAADDLSSRHDHEDLRMRVESALRCLSPRQREVLARYYGDSLTLREAGARMGISEARACQLHGRAIDKLRHQLSVAVGQPRARIAAA